MVKLEITNVMDYYYVVKGDKYNDKRLYIKFYGIEKLNIGDLIYIDDHAHITGGCRLLCHQRNLRHYRKGDDAAKLPYKLGEIHIGKGVMIGMESLIMPGVTIGDGAIVGAYSLVTKDIPAWTVATGRPAKVVKEIPHKEQIEK